MLIRGGETNAVARDRRRDIGDEVLNVWGPERSEASGV